MARFTRLCDRGQRSGFRRHHVHRIAQRIGRSHQGPGAAGRARGGLDRAVGRFGRRTGKPDQTAAPIEVTDRARNSAQHAGSCRGTHRHPPDALTAHHRQQANVAHPVPQFPRCLGRPEFERQTGRVPPAALRCGRRPTQQSPRCGSASASGQAAICSGNQDAGSAGRKAAPETPYGEPSAADNAATAFSASRPGMTMVPTASGAGSTFRVISVMTPSVPWLPVSSLHKSRPVTFFSTRPPEWMTSPRPVTARTPMT